MGSRSVSISFTPGENEQIETVIKLPEERRSIIHGVVKNHCNNVVKDAVVKLFVYVNQNDEQVLKPLTHTFTDDDGQFMFGPLWACKNYVIKVWVNDIKIRELVIKPEDYDCEPNKKPGKKPCNQVEKSKAADDNQRPRVYLIEDATDEVDE